MNPRDYDLLKSNILNVAEKQNMKREMKHTTTYKGHFVEANSEEELREKLKKLQEEKDADGASAE